MIVIDWGLRRIPFVLVALVVILLSCPGKAMSQSGESWDAPVSLSTNEKALYPYLAMDPWGGVHAIWNGASVPEPRAQTDTIFYSYWDGSRWSEPVDILVASSGQVLNRPVCAAGPDARLYIVWLSGFDVFMSSAPIDNAGSPRAWSTPRVIFESFDTAAFPYYVDFKIDDTGRFHLAAVKQLDDVFVIAYSFSIDQGRTWSSPAYISDIKVEVAAQNPKLAVATDGTIHAAWAEFQLPDGWPPLGVFYSRSTDGGQTWSAPSEMAGEGYGHVTVLVDSKDSVHLVWSGTIGVEGRYHRWSQDGGQTWTETERLPDVADSFGQSFSEMVVDRTGVIHLVTGVEHQRYLNWKDGAWSHAETIADVVSDAILIREGGMPRIALSQGNRLVVLYHDNWSVFFASKEILAPFRPSPTRPALTPTAGALSIRGPTPVPTSTAMQDTPRADPLEPDANDADLPAALLGTFVAGLVVTLVVIISVARRRVS